MGQTMGRKNENIRVFSQPYFKGRSYTFYEGDHRLSGFWRNNVKSMIIGPRIIVTLVGYNQYGRIVVRKFPNYQRNWHNVPYININVTEIIVSKIYPNYRQREGFNQIDLIWLVICIIIIFFIFYILFGFRYT